MSSRCRFCVSDFHGRLGKVAMAAAPRIDGGFGAPDTNGFNLAAI